MTPFTGASPAIPARTSPGDITPPAERGPYNLRHCDEDINIAVRHRFGWQASLLTGNPQASPSGVGGGTSRDSSGWVRPLLRMWRGR